MRVLSPDQHSNRINIDKKMTQAELADALGLTIATVSRLENGAAPGRQTVLAYLRLEDLPDGLRQRLKRFTEPRRRGPR